MRGLMASAGIAALLSAFGSAAAQEVGSGRSVAADQAVSVDTVVVTARRREEALAEVPLSASALGAEQIAQRPLEKIEDFLRQTPSATIVFAGPDYLKDVSIRGQGGGRNGFSESATGVYRNGIYAAGGGFGGRSLNALDLFDVRSFEVYRGPQGALYGRNSVGGAVNVITQRPTFDQNASFSAAYDDRDRLSGQAVLNAAIGSSAAVRLGFVGFDQDEGFITDLTSGRHVDQQSFVGARAAVRIAPTDDLDVTLTIETSDVDAPGFSSLGQRLPVATRPTARIDPGIYVRNASRYGRVDIAEDTAYLNVDRSLGFAELAIVGAYKDRSAARDNEDLDHFLGFEGIGGSDMTARQSEDYRRYGAEVRLTSTGGGRLSWMVGADWQDSRDRVETANGGMTNVPALGELVTRTDRSREDLTSVSIFASLDWQLTPALTLSLEGRAQRDEKDFRFERIDGRPTPVNTSIAPIFSSNSTTKVSPGATLKYAYAPDSQIYARVASAYRPGGFNVGTNVVGAIPYDPETAIGAELGWKTRLAGGVGLRASAYYLGVDDAQVVSTVSVTDTTVVLQNVEGLDSWGLEIELDGAWAIGPGRLAVSASASTQDGEYRDGSRATTNGVTYDVSGKRSNRQRDFIGSLSTTYSWPIFGDWSAWTTGTVTSELGGYENAVGQLKIPNVSREAKGYALVHLKAGVRSGDWTIAAYATNLTDKVYMVQEVLGNAYFNEGRVIGLELKRRLGN